MDVVHYTSRDISDTTEAILAWANKTNGSKPVKQNSRKMSLRKIVIVFAGNLYQATSLDTNKPEENVNLPFRNVFTHTPWKLLLFKSVIGGRGNWAHKASVVTNAAPPFNSLMVVAAEVWPGIIAISLHKNAKHRT